MSLRFDSEAALGAAAAEAGSAWRRAGIARLVVGLAGDLGSGKTTWARALLHGLGHTGRVPSPTFTLIEQYEIGELTVVHTDFYRLADPGELEFIGLRDWLAQPEVWLLAEWPDRGGAFREALDLEIRFEIEPGDARRLRPRSLSEPGHKAVTAWLGGDFN